MLFLAAATACACSLQNFDYLKNESASGGGSSKGGATSSSGGSDDTSGGTTAATSGGGSTRGGSTSGGATGSGADAGAGGVGDGGTGTGGSVSVDGGQAGEANGGTGGIVASGGTTASGGAPLVGNLLVNPSFELDFNGWAVSPTTALTGRLVFTQPDTTAGNKAVDGTRELSVWHATESDFTVTVSQVVKNLSPGTYTFKGFFSWSNREAYLFSRNCGGPDHTGTPPIAQFAWFEATLPPIEVTGSSCEVGLVAHNVANDWFNADAFSFEKVQ
ncbi:MAG: hypothetical protein QM756_12920 [Polyangiaceae bacterium]